METQIKELIEQIKSEGVDEAEKQAAQITEDSRKQAEATIEKARAEAEKIVSDAKAEADRFKESGKAAMEQSGRDLVLGLRSSITALLEKIVERDTKAALSDEGLQKIITELIKEWQKKDVDNIEVLLSQDDFKKLQDGAFAKLAQEMKKGVTFQPIPGIQAGFRVGEKKGSAYYDFTDQGIAQSIAAGLNPKLAECLKTEE